MSGGSWNYQYHEFEELAQKLSTQPDYKRRSMAVKVAQLATAMHDIEWVDSGDYGDGDEVKSIDLFLGADRNSLMLEELERNALVVMEDLRKELENIPKKIPPATPVVDPGRTIRYP